MNRQSILANWIWILGRQAGISVSVCSKACSKAMLAICYYVRAFIYIDTLSQFQKGIQFLQFPRERLFTIEFWMFLIPCKMFVRLFSPTFNHKTNGQEVAWSLLCNHYFLNYHLISHLQDIVNMYFLFITDFAGSLHSTATRAWRYLLAWRSESSLVHTSSPLPSGTTSQGLAIDSILFWFLFVETYWFALPGGQFNDPSWGQIFFSFLPSSNSVLSVLDPW